MIRVLVFLSGAVPLVFHLGVFALGLGMSPTGQVPAEDARNLAMVVSVFFPGAFSACVPRRVVLHVIAIGYAALTLAMLVGRVPPLHIVGDLRIGFTSLLVYLGLWYSFYWTQVRHPRSDTFSE